MPALKRSGHLSPAVCVSIRDVSAHDLELCQRLRDAIHAVAEIPVSLLALPEPAPLAASVRRLEAWLEARLAAGDELVLQACTEPFRFQDGAWLGRMMAWMRPRLAVRISSLAQARCRLGQGIDWFMHRRWPLHGFAAPAWMVSESAWRHVADYPFRYSLTRRRFLLLPGRQAIAAQSATCAIHRDDWRQHLPAGQLALGTAWRDAPMIRLCLRPQGGASAESLRYCQRWLAALLEGREAMTAAGYAMAWRQSTNRVRSAVRA